MSPRLTRAARAEANREDVLASARRVFLARGWTGASLEAIAEEAGFSKGVVYSQFGGKADLFLALLEQRIRERAEANEALATRHRGLQGLHALLKAARLDDEAEARWSLLLLEFRVLTLRDPEVHQRYASAHRLAVEGFARLLGRLLQEAGLEPVAETTELAALIFATGAGLGLEQATEGTLLGPAQVETAAARLLGLPPSSIHGSKRRSRDPAQGPTKKSRKEATHVP